MDHLASRPAGQRSNRGSSGGTGARQLKQRSPRRRAAPPARPRADWIALDFLPSKYPEKAATRLITDEQMVIPFACLGKAEAEGLEHPIQLLAVRLQFEFAARMLEILLLQWKWLDLPNGRVVWPDGKTAIRPSRWARKPANC